MLLAFALLGWNVGCSSRSNDSAEPPTTNLSVAAREFNLYEADGSIHLGHETLAVLQTDTGWVVETTFVADATGDQRGDADVWRGTLTTTPDWTPVSGSWHGRLGQLRALRLRSRADQPELLELVTEVENGAPVAVPQVSRVDLLLPGAVPGTRAVLCRLATDAPIQRALFPGVAATIEPRQVIGTTHSKQSVFESVVLNDSVPIAGAGPIKVICRGEDLIISRQGTAWAVAVGHEALARRLGAKL